MATSDGSKKALSSDETVSTDDLVVSLADGKTKNPSSIIVTIENRNSKYPISFLKWDSPVDPMSLNSGVFTIRDAASDDALPSPGLRVSRMLPPSREELIEIRPQGAFSEKLELKAPWIPNDGRMVKVQVEGQWRAIWPRAKSNIQDDELHSMTGDGIFKGPFRGKQIFDLQL